MAKNLKIKMKTIEIVKMLQRYWDDKADYVNDSVRDFVKLGIERKIINSSFHLDPTPNVHPSSWMPSDEANSVDELFDNIEDNEDFVSLAEEVGLIKE